MSGELNSNFRHGGRIRGTEHTDVFRQPLEKQMQEEREVPPVSVLSTCDGGVEERFTPIERCFCKPLGFRC